MSKPHLRAAKLTASKTGAPRLDPAALHAGLIEAVRRPRPDTEAPSLAAPLVVLEAVRNRPAPPRPGLLRRIADAVTGRRDAAPESTAVIAQRLLDAVEGGRPIAEDYHPAAAPDEDAPETRLAAAG
jgi:hypothetical protein